MLPSTNYHVLHPDGTTSTVVARGRAPYTHAVVAGPVETRVWRRRLATQADTVRADIATIQVAIAVATVVEVYNQRLILPGTDIGIWAPYTKDNVARVYDVATLEIGAMRTQLQHLAAQAAARPPGTYKVLRWARTLAVANGSLHQPFLSQRAAQYGGRLFVQPTTTQQPAAA